MYIGLFCRSLFRLNVWACLHVVRDILGGNCATTKMSKGTYSNQKGPIRIKSNTKKRNLVCVCACVCVCVCVSVCAHALRSAPWREPQIETGSKKRPIPIKRDLFQSKEKHKRDLVCAPPVRWVARRVCANCDTTKVSEEICLNQKRPTKETYSNQKRPTKETYSNKKRSTDEAYATRRQCAKQRAVLCANWLWYDSGVKRDVLNLKRPTKEMF